MIIKSKLAHIIYQTVYCTLAIIALLGTLGYFNAQFNANFYVYYTNLSNYICSGMMFVTLVLSIKNYHKNESSQSYGTRLKFLAAIMIMVTCLVYNVLLAKEKPVSQYFLSISNLLNHVILPIMFILDWILFYEHGKIKWFDPLLCTIFPLVYVVFILIRAAILSGATNTVLYPYFFLNVPKLGVGMFIMWIAILLVVFVAIGYLCFVGDNLRKWKSQRGK